jgi:SpoVK/Ycf46/Vps4 family AAA+-type ATPase
MDRLQDITWSAESYNSLVLGLKHKTLIRSLVMQHKRRAKLFDDIVAGKGQGLIGLFSGGPGCGKTLTAEAIAEITFRPLYVVSAGELGTTAVDVDKNLTQILELARTWDAVLLLDEAEVFLQKRTAADINRNALVSIFLRQLEYYKGILILTTNMIQTCDPAFESGCTIKTRALYADLPSKVAYTSLSTIRTWYLTPAKQSGKPSLRRDQGTTPLR